MRAELTVCSAAVTVMPPSGSLMPVPGRTVELSVFRDDAAMTRRLRLPACRRDARRRRRLSCFAIATMPERYAPRFSFLPFAPMIMFAAPITSFSDISRHVCRQRDAVATSMITTIRLILATHRRAAWFIAWRYTFRR